MVNGDGMSALFDGFGVRVLDGGPTLNPSTYDLLAAIHAVAAEEVVVLPNSANVQMAAERAADLSEKTVLVVPSRSPQAGLAAAVSLDPDRSAAENAAAMVQTLEHVRTGAVAPAARDDAQGRFRAGDAVGFVEEELVAWGAPRETLQDVLRQLAHNAELITCLRGLDAPLDDQTVHALVVRRDRARAVRRWSAQLLVAARRRVVRRSGHHQRVSAATFASHQPLATAFASSRPLADDELAAAPVRYPRPSRLAQTLVVDGAKAAAGRDLDGPAHGRRPDRAPAPGPPRGPRGRRAAPRGDATVVVSVRSIASRPVRRRGMRPLVEATVADDSGPMKATFFNQPWLVQKYPVGTGLVLHGKYEARNRFRVQGHAQTNRGQRRRRCRRALRRHRGTVLDPDPGPGSRPRRRHR